MGSVDESTAALGLARAMTESEKIRSILVHIQKQLYVLMSELAAIPDKVDQFKRISIEDVHWLEEQITNLENAVVLPKEFIIPGESSASAALAISRTIVRRSERRTIAFFEEISFTDTTLITYLNRLSSLIFVLEVYESSLTGRGLLLAKEE